MATSTPTSTRTSDPHRLARALAHPLRPRILQIMSERVASPNEVSRELDEPLGNVSYHVRMLREYDCIELVRTAPRRGAVEHYYRALVRPIVEDDAWGKLPLGIRRQLMGRTLVDVFEDVRAAGKLDGFDDPEVHVSRTPLELDERGWQKLNKLLAKTVDEAMKIAAESAGRLVEAPEDERRPVSSELAMLHFRRAPRKRGRARG